jgi:hypothetical protein
MYTEPFPSNGCCLAVGLPVAVYLTVRCHQAMTYILTSSLDSYTQHESKNSRNADAEHAGLFSHR